MSSSIAISYAEFPAQVRRQGPPRVAQVSGSWQPGNMVTGFNTPARLIIEPNSKCNISYLGNALVLDLARMLESTISNGSQHLGFEQEISEAAGVDGHVVALNLLALGGSGVPGIVSVSDLGLGLIFVIQKLLIDIDISHFWVFALKFNTT